MAKISWKGGALIAPIPPVLVTCSDGEHDNVLTVAWTGITDTVPPKTYVSIRPTRYSHDIIEKSGEFVINLAPVSLAKTVDRCGVYTGRKMDKFAKMNLTREKATVVSCPMIAECPLSIECRVTDKLSLGSHDMFLADIVAVNVEESLLSESGKLRIERADLLAFAHGEYFALGRRIGSFGFGVRKKANTVHKKSK